MADNQPEPVNTPDATDQEPELYLEPAKLTMRDALGVILALIVLALIGGAGYVWLNPDLGWDKLWSKQTATVASQPEPKVAKGQDADPDTASTASTPAAEDFTCAQCGMDASKSLSHAVVTWADGAVNHFDSWDCAFNYAKDQTLSLASATVNEFDAAPAAPEMLDAAQAWFLYDTKETVEGSMPPYVAAYPTKDAATAAQAALGGELLDFTGLQAKWK